MENIKDATYYAKKIINESRHKFIYSYNKNRTLLIKELKKHPVTIGNDPCALYYNIEGLQNFNCDISKLDKSVISIICDEYFAFSIACELISSVIDNNDLEKIKQLEHSLLDYVNRFMSKSNINSITELYKQLKDTKEIYYEIYCSYLQKSVLLNPMDKAPLDFIELSDFVNGVKKMLEKNTHISFVLNHTSEVCLESYKAINNLVASRINGDISVNILTEPNSWKSYIAQNGQLIEATHDYENIDYDESSTEYVIKMKKLYQKKE